MTKAQDRVAEYWRRTLAQSRQLVFVIDTSRRIAAVSEGFASAVGARADDLVGHACDALMHGGESPDACPLRDLLLDAGQHDGEVHSEVLGKDLFVTVTPLPDETGHVGHILHVATDITGRKHIEEALRENEERFAALFNDAPLGYQSLNEEGRFVEVNAMWLATLGYSRDEVMGRWFGDFLAPEFVEAFRERFPLFKEQGFIHSEFEMLHKEGGRRTIAFEGRIGHNADGSFRQTHCILSDITTSTRAEAALRESERLLRQSQEVARLGHYVLDVHAGSWTSSATLDEVFGIDAAFERSVEGWLDIVHPDDRPDMAAYFEHEVIAERRPFDREYRIRRIADGEERWVHGLGALEQGADGQPSRMFGTIQDVTERQLAEEQVLRQAERLRQTVEGTVQAMGQLVEARDPYTAGHERRVAELAAAIAASLRWSDESIGELRTAALVHDIGKNAVPAEILNKPGRLSPLEFALVKSHSRSGYEILAPIDFGAPVAEVVLQHHERLDGSGYPGGLHGGEILPAARVLCIADVFEAMVTHRPYRPALPVEEAIAEIRSGLGVRYDDEAGLACLRLVEDEGFAFADAG